MWKCSGQCGSAPTAAGWYKWLVLFWTSERIGQRADSSALEEKQVAYNCGGQIVSHSGATISKWPVPPPPIRPCTPLTIYSYLLFSVVLKQVRRNKTRYKSGTGLPIPNNDNKLKKDVTSVGSFCFFLCVSEKPQQHKQLERSSTDMTVLQLRTKPYLPSNKPVF